MMAVKWSTPYGPRFETVKVFPEKSSGRSFPARALSARVLEAAHIRPYTSGGEHALANGLLLRADLHRLFDKGFVTVTPRFRQ